MWVNGKVEERKRAAGLTTEKGKASSRKSKGRQKKTASVVQRLFDTCKEVFAGGGPGIVPSQEDVSRLSSFLDSMKPEDVDLDPALPYFSHSNSERLPSITYIHLKHKENFSIGIFCLPESAVIPLHDHPGMTVFSKLLFGSIHIKSYDWVDTAQISNETIRPREGERLAKVKTDDVFNDTCKTSILYPESGGNMHCFTALTPCAVLDVLGPPYSPSEGRDSTYFDDFPYSSFPVGHIMPGEEEKYAWLKARPEKPEGFTLDVAEYKGPKILDK
ncbi:plant cysteine oxidase 2-like isoform X1 [Typha angustifolia]|uniref:plant cysteine oxidase 2-like isoform X1 n=1 Tax=Typha angustifolia TaxID=59011 RepID=UPI003C2FAED2